MENEKELERDNKLLNLKNDTAHEFTEFQDFLIQQNLLKNFSLQRQYLFTFHYLKNYKEDLKNINKFCKEINQIFQNPISFKPLILKKLIHLTKRFISQNDKEYEVGLFSLDEKLNEEYNFTI